MKTLKEIQDGLLEATTSKAEIMKVRKNLKRAITGINKSYESLLGETTNLLATLNFVPDEISKLAFINFLKSTSGDLEKQLVTLDNTINKINRNFKTIK